MDGTGERRGNEAGSALFPLKGALKSDTLQIDWGIIALQSRVFQSRIFQCRILMINLHNSGHLKYITSSFRHWQKNWGGFFWDVVLHHFSYKCPIVFLFSEFSPKKGRNRIPSRVGHAHQPHQVDGLALVVILRCVWPMWDFQFQSYFLQQQILTHFLPHIPATAWPCLIPRLPLFSNLAWYVYKMLRFPYFSAN